jgi:GntR family transcriptional repressor for pyruvate dehydrogenase complex
VTSTDRLLGIGAIEIEPAYEVVVRHLRRAIHLGTFPPGAKLPPERELAALLNVSRATLREALRALKGEGYVEIRRGQLGGVFVQDGLASSGGFGRWLAAQRTDVEAVFAFRLVVEPLAARRAAVRGGAELVDELTELNACMAETPEIGEFRRADLRFHMRIADAAGAELVRHAVEESRAALFLPFQLLDLEDIRTRSVPEHGQIIAALHDRDADRAEREMAAHVRGTARVAGTGPSAG